MGNSYDTPKTEIVTVYDVIFIPKDKKMYPDKYRIHRCFYKKEAEKYKNMEYVIKKSDGSTIKTSDVDGELVIVESNELFYK